MKGMTQEEQFIIKHLKEKGSFDPKNSSYNTVLKELKRKGWLNIIESETSDIPILITPSKEFDKKYIEYFSSRTDQQKEVETASSLNTNNDNSYDAFLQRYEELSQQIEIEKSQKNPDVNKIKALSVEIYDLEYEISLQIKNLEAQKKATQRAYAAEEDKKIPDPKRLSEMHDFSEQANSEINRLRELHNSITEQYPENPLIFRAEEDHFSIKTKKVDSCFGVDDLAVVFARHINSLNNEDSQMIGIFGKWGRGKTYFWEKTKEKLEETHKGKYTFVEFNAWKYQETPALWAYLYISFLDVIKPNKWYRFWYNVWQNKFKVGFNLIAFITFIVMLFWAKPEVFGIEPDVAKWIFGVGGVALFGIKEYKNNISPVLDSLKKALKGNNHVQHLGCQAEIEEDLVRLIKHCVKKKEVEARKIILFIDDIDRCDDEKMIKIINSLRTILENPEISKRLIIICAIDDKRLIEALKEKYSKCINLAREQMDKIFISGIKLRSISCDEQIEFIKELAKNSNNNQSDKSDNISSSTDESTTTPPNTNAKNATTKNANTTDEKILHVFSKLLKNMKDEDDITPRQLRVIYYRYKLANNILKGDSIPHDEIATSIYLRTVGEECKIKLDTRYKNVVDTVVCY